MHPEPPVAGAVVVSAAHDKLTGPSDQSEAHPSFAGAATAAFERGGPVVIGTPKRSRPFVQGAVQVGDRRRREGFGKGDAAQVDGLVLGKPRLVVPACVRLLAMVEMSLLVPLELPHRWTLPPPSSLWQRLRWRGIVMRVVAP